MFFKLSEKQHIVLSKQPIVLLLGVFEKVENCFGWLTCCQTKTIDCFMLSIDCLFENPNRNFVLLLECALNIFQLNTLMY